MRALPDRYRVVAYLAGVEGRSYQQIADITGIPLGGVKSRLSRARHRLRAELCAHAPQN
jgi:RNA polymerase sigma-70 factor, ECF subfamily